MTDEMSLDGLSTVAAVPLPLYQPLNDVDAVAWRHSTLTPNINTLLNPPATLTRSMLVFVICFLDRTQH